MGFSLRNPDSQSLSQNEDICTRQMEPALPLGVPLVVSARKIKPHRTRQAPLNPNPVQWFLAWKYDQPSHCLPPRKCISSLGFDILKGKAGFSGSSPIPLHGITSGTDYSAMLFGWWCPRHSGDPASWEHGNLRAAHLCLVHLSHWRQRRSRKRTSMLTDLKHFKTVTNMDWFIEIFVSARAQPFHSHQLFVSFWATVKVPCPSFFVQLNYLA